LALQRIGGLGDDGVAVETVEGAFSVHRDAEAVEGAAQKLGADGDAEAVAGGFDEAARADAGKLAEGHEEYAVATEADDFGLDDSFVLGVDETKIADTGVGAVRLDDESDDLDDAAGYLDPVGPVDGGFDVAEIGFNH